MTPRQLLTGLGTLLGVDLTPGKVGTCSVFFDEDKVDFEIFGERLYVFADVAPSVNHLELCPQFMEANFLGLATGGAVLSLDTTNHMYVLHMIVDEGTTDKAFEERLTLFVKALRYWKAWFAKQPDDAAHGASNVPLGNGAISV